MKGGVRSAAATARLLWACALAILVAAWYGVEANYEPRIDALNEHARVLFESYRDDLAIERESHALDADRKIAAGDLRRYVGRSNSAAQAARLLRDIDNLASTTSVELVSLVPGGTAPPASYTALPAGIDRSPIELRASGRYPALLRFIQHLSRQDVALSVDAVSFAARADDASGRRPPVLDATITASVYHFQPTYEESHLVSVP